jgi:phosphoribosylaminoimidazole-succinocarboxamide synthase
VGLEDGSKLSEPAWTPSTKESDGSHDTPISSSRAGSILGVEMAERVRRASVMIYEAAAKYALDRGVVVVDTKFEFGTDKQGRLYLIDEVLTPDSSRFWPVAADGTIERVSYDKQYVRDYLLRTGFNKKDPVEIPEDVIAMTRSKYLQVYRKLTGVEFE